MLGFALNRLEATGDYLVILLSFTAYSIYTIYRPIYKKKIPTTTASANEGILSWRTDIKDIDQDVKTNKKITAIDYFIAALMIICLMAFLFWIGLIPSLLVIIIIILLFK